MRKKKENGAEIEQDDPIQNLLGSLLTGYKEDVYNGIENEKIPFSSGSLLIDSHVKLRSGCVVRFGGSLESGKTSQCLLILGNYLDTIPNSRGLYVKAEGRLSDEIQVRSGRKFVYNQDDWEIGTIFVLESNIFEAVCDIIQSLLKNMFEKGEKLGFIIDSLDGLILKSDYEKKTGESVQPAGVPKLTKMFFRRMALAINKYDSLALLTSQYSESFKIDKYAKDKPQPVQGTGGSAVSHQPDWIFEYGIRYTSHYILEDDEKKPDPVTNKILGHIVNMTIRKSTNEKTGTVIHIPIRYGQIGNSIWKEKEVADMLLNWEIVKKDKNTYSFDATIIKEAAEKGLELKTDMVGINKYYKYINDNKEVCDFFYDKLVTINNQLTE